MIGSVPLRCFARLSHYNAARGTILCAIIALGSKNSYKQSQSFILDGLISIRGAASIVIQGRHVVLAALYDICFL